MKVAMFLPVLIAGLGALMPVVARAQGAPGWKPERPIELVVSCAPGCGPDNMARLMQRVFQ